MNESRMKRRRIESQNNVSSVFRLFLLIFTLKKMMTKRFGRVQKILIRQQRLSDAAIHNTVLLRIYVYVP